MLKGERERTCGVINNIWTESIPYIASAQMVLFIAGIVLTDDDYGGGRGLSLHPRASPLIAMRGVGGFILTMELETSDRRRPTRKSLASRAGISNGA